MKLLSSSGVEMGSRFAERCLTFSDHGWGQTWRADRGDAKRIETGICRVCATPSGQNAIDGQRSTFQQKAKMIVKVRSRSAPLL